MINAFSRSPGMRPASVGYLATLGIALPGMVFVAIGVGSELKARAGHDPIDAINAVGLPTMLFVWFLLYAFRLIFWRKVPDRWQATVRVLLTAVLAIEFLSAIAALALLTSSGRVVAVAFTGLGALCQIATVTWLVRHRKE